MNSLVIYGAGGFAREVRQLVLDLNRYDESWKVEGFLDDNSGAGGDVTHNLPILGGLDWLSERPDAHVVIGIGAPATRRRVVERIRSRYLNPFATITHPSAIVGARVTVGEGTIICAGTVITTDVAIGSHVHINLSCTIGHDSSLGDFVTLSPNVSISGNVHVSEGCELGTSTAIIPAVSVGAWSVMGAGTIAIKDIQPNVTVVGNPARVVRERSSGWHLDEEN